MSTLFNYLSDIRGCVVCSSRKTELNSSCTLSDLLQSKLFFNFELDPMKCVLNWTIFFYHCTMRMSFPEIIKWCWLSRNQLAGCSVPDALRSDFYEIETGCNLNIWTQILSLHIWQILLNRRELPEGFTLLILPAPVTHITRITHSNHS